MAASSGHPGSFLPSFIVSHELWVTLAVTPQRQFQPRSPLFRVADALSKPIGMVSKAIGAVSRQVVMLTLSIFAISRVIGGLSQAADALSKAGGGVPKAIFPLSKLSPALPAHIFKLSKGAVDRSKATTNAFIWETLPATATEAQHATSFDFDGDGTNNLNEFASGAIVTNPAP